MVHKKISSWLQETLLRICCAMLILVRRRLLAGDFTSNLKLLQNYPSTNISHLLYVANKLRGSSAGWILALCHLLLAFDAICKWQNLLQNVSYCWKTRIYLFAFVFFGLNRQCFEWVLVQSMQSAICPTTSLSHCHWLAHAWFMKNIANLYVSIYLTLTRRDVHLLHSEWKKNWRG